MNALTFRWLVVASALCAIGSMTIDYVLLYFSDETLLRQVLGDLPFRVSLEPGWPVAVLAGAVVAMLAWIAATAGLLAFKAWARPVALVATVLELALMAAGSGMELSDWAGLLHSLSWLTWGAVLAGAYAAPAVQARFAARTSRH
jgi:hypothetical protein